jgi:hypothetical protein
VSVWADRVADASAETKDLTDRLYDACMTSGRRDPDMINEAIEFAAFQLDPEADDYEVWECVVFCRYDEPMGGVGER